MELTEEQIRRIAKRTARAEAQSATAQVANIIGGGSVPSSTEAQHAKEADHAAAADTATTADTAKEADHAKKAAALDDDALENFDNKYLHKDQDDETTHKLTMGAAHVKGNAKVDGQTVTDDIHSADSGGDTSMTGRGWTLKNVTDETGTYSVLAVDNIIVRKKMEAAELEIHRKTYVGAQQIASDWGHKILRVDPVDYNAETGEITAIGLTLFTLPVTIDGVQRMVAFVGRQLSSTETRVELLGDGKGILNQELEMTANAFKVYFCESDGTASVEDDLVVGSLGQCQEFNVKERVTHHFTNSYYWGVCLAHGVEQDVLIGDKATPCVWGVFSHSTALLTLTSEVSGGKFTCYGMEQSGCTFPVVGDDMVAFGCADPWQDSDRSNAIITASKDGQHSAPSVIAYSNIGRMRGGQLVGTLASSATPAAYASISEQYTLPTDKADSRLDFRISKPKGNVFKGDMYFRGDDGTLHPVGATYMLSANKSVVEHGGDLTVSVYKVVAGKAELMSADAFKNAGLQLSLTRSEGTTADVTSAYPTISWSTLSNNNSNVKNVVIKLLKDNKILDTTSVALGEKAVAQTEEWRLIPVMERATIDYDIDKDQYSNYAESGETGDDTLDKVFKKTGNISLRYNILHRKSDLMQLFSSMSGTPVGYYLAVTEFNANNGTIASYRSDDGNVGGTHLHDSLMFTDTSTDAANVSRITVMLYDKDSNALDRREVSMNLGTNGVFEMNKKFLAYIYYGTDGKKGAQYINRHVTTMEGNYTSLEQRVTTAEGGIEKNEQKITETADEYERKLTQETKDRAGAISDLETRIKATTDGIDTAVKSLYSTGNLLYGANVMGMFRKCYLVYSSEDFSVKKGITYTLTMKAWMNDDYHSEPYYRSHKMRVQIMVNGLVYESHDYRNTPAIGYYNNILFTAEEDTTMSVRIYEVDSDGTDPKTYGGIFVDWLRVDMGDHSNKDNYYSWGPAAKDIETINLLPDPGFSDAIKVSSLGATREYTDGDVSYMYKYTADTATTGCYGLRMKRSGANKTSSDGLRYYIPFRGAGKYTLSAFFKNINTVKLDGECYIELHTCDKDLNRIGNAESIELAPSTGAEGYELNYDTFDLDDVEESKAVCWIELRVFMSMNGDIVVGRICLAKCDHRIDYNANNLSKDNQQKIASESYAYQRADSIGAGIRKGLQSVGFKMDSATWSVNTWGNKFAWYATEADANKGTNAKMWLDTNTDTLHVKGYVEATGGKIGNLELVSDGDATFVRSKDSSGKYIEKSRSVMSSRSITFYEQHSDGRFSIVDPVSWIIKIQSDADHPGKGLQSVKMEGYSYMFPGHSVELGDNTTPTNWAKMTGMGIGYSTNGRAIAKVFQSGTGGLAMVCVAYGMINADGTFDAEKQTQMALDYNCTVERVNKRGTGWYECTLRQKPHGLYTVFVRARVSSGGNVMYATLGAVSVYTFTVMTSDDSSRNDCDFEYFVVSFGGY